MFRAIRLGLAAAILLALFVLPALDRGAHAEKTLLNGIGLVDYSKPPDFKVGTYVSYQTIQSADGIAEPGEPVTLLVPGEERFWGDDCFWLETRQGEASIMSLISYAVFQDSFPQYRMRFYTRKTISGLDDNGNLDEQLQQMPPSLLKSRAPLPSGDRDRITDLGPDTVSTPFGTFTCKKIETKRGTGTTQDVGDSTVYTEEYETRTSWFTSKIPMTHLAKEDVDVTVSRKAWRIGHSDPAQKMILMKHSTMSSRVQGFGEGMKSEAFPAERQKSLARGTTAAATPPAAKAKSKKAAPPKTTAR